MAKVYEINVDLGSFQKGWNRNAPRETAALGFAIADLAAQSGETVWFHQRKDNTLGGAPAILLECSDAFLEKVKMLPAYNKSREAPKMPGLETERSPRLQQFFATPAPVSPARKPPGFKP